jgi:hypothetical protein
VRITVVTNNWSETFLHKFLGGYHWGAGLAVVGEYVTLDKTF